MMDLNSYLVSETTGFCLEEPLTQLQPEFREWHEVASAISDLIEQGTVRQTVNKMKQVDASSLTSVREQLLGHLQLSTIATGYVWGCGDDDVAKSLPASVAVPLYSLSTKLGLEPSLSHANRCLANWTRINPEQPITLENIDCLYPFLNAGLEARFLTNVVNLTELAFAPAIKAVMVVMAAEVAGDTDAIIVHLDTISQSLKDMEVALARIHDGLGVMTFLYQIIPYSRGWGSAPDSPIPDGLVFEGVSDTPLKTGDDTAAHTPTLQTVDALLGVRPTEENRSFHLSMREHMLPGHRRFIEAIEQRPTSLRDMVENSSSKELREAYNRCLTAAAAFRSKHVQVFAKYFIVASKKKSEEAASKGEHMETPDFTEIGDLLKGIRQTTLEEKIPTDSATDAE